MRGNVTLNPAQFRMLEKYEKELSKFTYSPKNSGYFSEAEKQELSRLYYEMTGIKKSCRSCSDDWIRALNIWFRNTREKMNVEKPKVVRGRKAGGSPPRRSATDQPKTPRSPKASGKEVSAVSVRPGTASGRAPSAKAPRAGKDTGTGSAGSGDGKPKSARTRNISGSAAPSKRSRKAAEKDAVTPTTTRKGNETGVPAHTRTGKTTRGTLRKTGVDLLKIIRTRIAPGGTDRTTGPGVRKSRG